MLKFQGPCPAAPTTPDYDLADNLATRLQATIVRQGGMVKIGLSDNLRD